MCAYGDESLTMALRAALRTSNVILGWLVAAEEDNRIAKGVALDGTVTPTVSGNEIQGILNAPDNDARRRYAA